jgi:hypothetical protein
MKTIRTKIRALLTVATSSFDGSDTWLINPSSGSWNFAARLRPKNLIVLASLLVWFGSFVRLANGGTLLDPRPENSTTLFGYAVAVIGDVNNDHVPDLAVGAPFQDGDFLGAAGFGNPQNVGKVWLVSGSDLSVIRELNDPEFQVQQSQKFGGQFGSSVADAGDVNGDGVDDVIVGTPHHITNPKTKSSVINAGRAFVFSGKDGTLLFTLDDPTPQEGARLGAAVAGIGDVNGDNVPDFLVGAPGKDTPNVPDSQVGIAYIFSGMDGTKIRSLTYPNPLAADAGASFGAAVAKVTGTTHVIVGAPRRSRAFVFDAATGTLSFTLTPPVADTETNPSFGFAVASGSAGIIVGAPLQNNLSGKVYAFPSTGGTAIWSKVSPDPQTFARFGAALGIIGANVLVGAPDQDVTPNTNVLINAGEAFILSGTDGTLLTTLKEGTPQANAGFGFSLASADLNKDGTPDLIIGTPFQNADLLNSHLDIQTHLQIGQIETQ